MKQLSGFMNFTRILKFLPGQCKIFFNAQKKKKEEEIKHKTAWMKSQSFGF